MPKRTPGVLETEENVAAHVQREREARGWSTAELAKRMTRAGCPMNQSAVWRIESGEPRRRITVEELLGFARVFRLSIDDLLSPDPERAEERQLMQEVEVYLHGLKEERKLRRFTETWMAVLVTRVWVYRDLEERIPDFIQEYASQMGLSPYEIHRRFQYNLATADIKGSPPLLDPLTWNVVLEDPDGMFEEMGVMELRRVAMAKLSHTLDEPMIDVHPLSGSGVALDIGRQLREAREKRGLSPLYVSSVVELTASWVVRIEEGNLDNLGGVERVRQVIRVLAETAHCNPQPLLNAYDEALQSFA
jgi:transcriptional regulator with XRE-family HTH domain